MKIIGTFGVVMAASIALLQPAEGRSRGSTPSFSSAPRFSAPARHFSSAPRNFSSSARHFSARSTRFSSPATFRKRVASDSRLAVNRRTALNPKTDSRFDSRRSTDRKPALRRQGFDSNQGRVLTRHTRNWDRRRDHCWRGHRCRWRNNCWVIIGPWLYPWGYGYYPYGTYSYYDNGYYDDGYASNEYDSENSDSSVSQVQAALAREGYYRGAIDGSFGPATQNALRRYQRSHGLDVTGQIDRPVIEALGLG
jgi:putative peptidoglycan binding protein